MSPKKVYICDFNECEKMFKAKYSLTRHIKSKHFKKKKFIWKHCNKKFALLHNLKEHEYIHTQALPFVCGIDGWTQSFRQRGKLCLHRWKHPNYNKRKYKKNSDLNNDEEDINEAPTLNETAMNFQNTNFSFTEPMRQRQSAMGYLNSMNSSYNMMGQMMKSNKMDQYQVMGGMDYAHPPTLDYSHRPQEMHPKPNKFLSDNLMNIESQNINKNFCYDSDNSEEESKGYSNKNDEMFQQPFSSMYRKKEGQSMSNVFSNDFKEVNYEQPKYEQYMYHRNVDQNSQMRSDKPVYNRMR